MWWGVIGEGKQAMSRSGKMASMGVVAACLVFLAWYLVAYGQGGGEEGAAASGAAASDGAASDAAASDGAVSDAAASDAAASDAAASDGAASDAAGAPEGAGDGLRGKAEVGSGTEASKGGPEEESAAVAAQPVSGASGRASSAPEPGTGSSGGVPEVSGARIQFDSDTFDFGTLYQRGTVEHEFTFRNVGDSPLTITKVVSTCACAATAPSKKELGAGESGAIEVEVRAGLLRGKLTKAVYVESNAVNEPRATLTITGEIKQEVEVKPLGVYIGRRKVGETMERTVMIRGVEATEFSILEVTASDPSVQVEGPVRLAGDVARYEMTIRFGPAEKAGRVNLKVMVQTDLEHTPKIAIPVYGRVVEGE